MGGKERRERKSERRRVREGRERRGESGGKDENTAVGFLLPVDMSLRCHFVRTNLTGNLRLHRRRIAEDGVQPEKSHNRRKQ